MVYYLVGSGYNPENNSVFLRFYDEELEIIFDVEDSTFKSYVLTNAVKNTDNMKNVGYIKEVEKFDALHNAKKRLYKVEFETPFDVKQTHKEGLTFWENHIRVHMSYIYENNISMGMPHIETSEGYIQLIDEKTEEKVEKLLKLFPDHKDIKQNLIRLFEYPIPNYKRASLDIEVENETENRIPRCETANLPVLCVCFKTSAGRSVGFLLMRDKQFESLPDFDELHVFTDEKEMLRVIFKFVNEFPFIITFNGDDFDLTYLRNRALRLRIPESEQPFIRTRSGTYLKYGIHVDLYKFFSILAIKNYAFKGKYKNESLDAISKALIGRGKIETETWVNELSHKDLINYCMNDADITYELTAFNNNITMNLITIISRMSKLPMESVTRRGVGRWIASYLFQLHRKLDYLIPDKEDIIKEKGTTTTQAIIKGKKYKGAIVIEPVEGVHFNTVMVDFGSLYPSVIKNYNIGYSTINCPHEECKSNVIGDMSHWICKKQDSLEAVFIGCIRDLRLKWYKQKAKDKTLSKNERDSYSVVEQTIKVFMNAGYGVFGNEGFELYCPPVAEEVAGISRYIMTQTAQKAIDMGLEVVYGDTDSIFIKDPNPLKVKELQDWCIKTWNIEFELDKEYRYVCFSSRKKNYIGVTKDGDLDVKGLTGKKSHTPLIFRNSFDKIKEALKTVEVEEDIIEVKRMIRRITIDTYKTLKRRKWVDLEELAFHVVLKKDISKYIKTTPQHVKAVKQLQAAGYDFSTGSIVTFVKTINKEGVRPIQLAKNEEIDIKKYEEFMRTTFGQILEPLDMDFDELIGVTKLTKWQ